MFKTCTLAFAAFLAITEATPCNMGQIQGKLLANGTEGLKNCANTTGYDIWATTDFPTEDQAKKIMQTRDCVAFINQINERANQDIQCDLKVGGVDKDFGMFLVSLLTGKTGNETEASGSGSDEVELTDASSKEDVVATVKPILDSSSSGNSFTPSAAKKASNSTPTATPKASDAPMAARAVVSAGLLAVAGLALQL